MIPVDRYEISTNPTGIYFTQRLHGETKFYPSEVGKFST